MDPTPEQIESSRTAVRAAGDRTIEQYQNWMQTNGAAHLMRTARTSGIAEALRERQHTAEELCEKLSLDRTTTDLLLDGLVSIGFLEQYEDDFALARAGHLLCQYDQDLGDNRWNQLDDFLKTPADCHPDLKDYRNRLAATQWIHTAAAMQAAEILDAGGQEDSEGLRVLDLGCGSAVWSCAIAHRDPKATVVAVDDASPLEAAQTTASSIGLDDRFETVEGEPLLATPDSNSFDLVLLPQVLSAYGDTDCEKLLKTAAAALKPGGRVAAPDLYRGPGRTGLKESLNRLSLHLATPSGRIRDLRECETMFIDAGLPSIQFTYLAASEMGLGMIVAEKSGESEPG